MARGRNLLFLGIILSVTGISGVVGENANHSACNSDLGQFAQALDNKVHGECAVDNTLWFGGIALALGGGAAAVAGTIRSTQQNSPGPGQVPPSWPPGWYPDPQDRQLQRWWDGQGWSPHVRRR